MKIIRLLALLITLTGLRIDAATWLTDSAAAYQRARSENKAVLFNFTGSDWCGWCVRLQREVFTQPEFDKFASDNLILVEVDFPRKKVQSPAQIKANDALASGFNIRGYPTIILADGQGKVIGRTGYHPGGPKPYIGELQRILGNRVKVPYGDKASTGSSEAPAKAAPPEPRPMFSGAPTAPPARFSGLQLKGMAGQKSRPLAIINNETLSVGETAMVKLNDGTVNIRLESIAKNSVIISLVETGERMDLELGGHPPKKPKTVPVVR
jgi:protein disulfide-isomerase